MRIIIKSIKKLTFTSVLLATAAWAGTYSHFSVEGNNRIDDSVVLAAGGLTEGREVGDAELNQAVQKLYASGLFAEVKVETSGSSVTIFVKENGTVSDVYFEGNSKIKDEELREIVTIGPRDGLDRQKIEENVQLIKRFYASRSRFDVEVTPELIDNGNGTYKLIFVIDEGSVSEVERITFNGNNEVSDWRLRRVIGSKEAGVFAAIFSGDNFQSERLEDDRSAILDYYQENGYYNARVETVQSDYDAGGNYYVTFNIYEGQKFRIGKVTLSSDIAGVNAEDFGKFLEVRTGRVYRRSEVRKSLDAIETEAERLGLAFLRATPEFTANEKDATLDINFKLANGDRNYVERIDIHGNDTTVDRVIRREFESAEGDPVNERKLDETREKLQSMGIFSNVQVQERAGTDTDQKIIDVEVEEASTGSLTFSGSYSNSEDGWGIGISYSERNFMGRGQYLGLEIDYGGSESTGTLTFTEPKIFDRNVSAGFDLYLSQRSNSGAGFEYTGYGFEPRLAFPINKDSRFSIGYFVKNVNIDEFYDNASDLVKEFEGETWTSGVSAVYTIDKTDVARDATRGWLLRLGGKYAGLGGDHQWTQIAGKVRYYQPLWNNMLQLQFEGEAGSIQGIGGDEVPINERYYIGGYDTLKGFSSYGVGPRDVDSSSGIDSALGGNQFAVVRAQLGFPMPGFIHDLGMSGALWWEAGSVWGLDQDTTIDDEYHLRASNGASLLWNIGGPTVVFSLNNPYLKEDYDKTEKYTVSIQTSF